MQIDERRKPDHPRIGVEQPESYDITQGIDQQCPNQRPKMLYGCHDTAVHHIDQQARQENNHAVKHEDAPNR